MLRLVRILDGFLQTQLIALHLGDARLIGFHNPIVPRIDDTIDQGIDLLVELADLLAGGIAAHGCLAETLIPCVLEHGAHHVEDALGRLQRLEHSLEVPFELIPADRLPTADTTLRRAKVVRMLFARIAL
jgi:hypothetical protein